MILIFMNNKLPNKFPYIMYSSIHKVHIFVIGKGCPPGSINALLPDTVGYPIELLKNSTTKRYYSMSFIDRYFHLI